MSASDKIIGYKSIKRELITLADMMRNGSKYTKLGVKLPRGILLCGEPGVGKTLMAKCLLEESGRNVFVLRKDKPNGDFVKAIQETFREAKEHQPSIVLLDDLDKYSNESRPRSDAEEYVLVQTCMDDTGEDDVFVVATVNRLSKLPDSLLREGRLGWTVGVQPPRGKDAVEIVRHYLGQKAYVGEINVEDVAKILNGDSCATLEEVINEAGIYAASQDKEMIDADDLLRGILRAKFGAPERMDDISLRAQTAVAYHEAGHTVVAEILERGNVTMTSIATHDGAASGLTTFYQDDDYWTEFSYMEHRVLALLGGRAATEIVYARPDVGATSDIKRVFDVVERFVDYDGVAPFDCHEREEGSSDALNRKDKRIAEELEKYYKQAKQILVENRPFLDAVAKELVAKKTLLASDIKRIEEELGM